MSREVVKKSIILFVDSLYESYPNDFDLLTLKNTIVHLPECFMKNIVKENILPLMKYIDTNNYEAIFDSNIFKKLDPVLSKRIMSKFNNMRDNEEEMNTIIGWYSYIIEEFKNEYPLDHEEFMLHF